MERFWRPFAVEPHRNLPRLFLAAALLSGPSALLARQTPPATSEGAAPSPAKPKPFEIGNGTLFEALRQLAAYRKLDLVIDSDVTDRKGTFAFKHTSWEKALDSLLKSQGLGKELKDGVLRVGYASRFHDRADASPAPSTDKVYSRRFIQFFYRPSSEGEGRLEIMVTSATREEILAILTRIESLAKSKAKDQESISGSWTLPSDAKGELHTFELKGITPSGLRALYP